VQITRRWNGLHGLLTYRTEPFDPPAFLRWPAPHKATLYGCRCALQPPPELEAGDLVDLFYSIDPQSPEYVEERWAPALVRHEDLYGSGEDSYEYDT
jgi:hypothetical protein